jgi:predicted transcriptional regulator
LQAKLDRIAAENSSEADQYVQQLVEHYLDHDVWLRQKVKKSLERLDCGELLTHEEMGARIEKKFGS